MSIQTFGQHRSEALLETSIENNHRYAIKKNHPCEGNQKTAIYNGFFLENYKGILNCDYLEMKVDLNSMLATVVVTDY